MRLYYLTTLVKEFWHHHVSGFYGYKNVELLWFRGRDEKARKRPYAKLIAGYDPKRENIVYAEHYIEQLFTADQARKLKDYLDKVHLAGETTTIGEVPLPIPNDAMNTAGMAVGGTSGSYDLKNNVQRYDLPFDAWCYYSVFGCEPVPGQEEAEEAEGWELREGPFDEELPFPTPTEEKDAT
jgi:hypothetical protein